MPISYAPTSWNPAIGCEPVSEGCKNCWAEKLHNRRYKANVIAALAGTGEAFKKGTLLDGTPPQNARVQSLDNRFNLPFPEQYDVPFAQLQFLLGRLSQPLRWRKPRTVAVCFMGDLFEEHVPDEFIERVLATAWVARLHRYLFLTKRAERMHAFFQESPKRIYNIGVLGEEIAGRQMPSMIWPLPNVWLGVTAENQRMADERIPLLLDTPAAHRWVSLEPLLGAVDLTHYLPRLATDTIWPDAAQLYHRGLDWVVVGGESGPGHRPMDQAWVWDIYDQCGNADVPYYGKQIAASRPGQPLPAHLGRKELPW